MVVDREAFDGSLRTLRAEASTGADPGGAALAGLFQRATAATETISAVDGAGLSLYGDDGLLRWVAVTSRAAQTLERVQQDLDEGPCLDAIGEGRTVSSTDVTADPRWPRLARTLREHPVRAVLSVPIRLRGRSFGALDVHASDAHEWDPEEVKAVVALTEVIAGLLDAAARAEEHAGRAAQLEYALEARVLIEQAKGVLIARDGLTGAAAFDRLRGNARAARRKVVDVAKDILAEAAGAPGTSRLLAAERRRRIAAEQANQRLGQLQAVTAAFASAVSVDEVAEVAVTQGAEALGADAALVAVVAPGGAIEVIAGAGADTLGVEPAPPGPRRDRRIPLSSPVPVAEAARTGTAIWLGTRAEQAGRYPVLAATGPAHEAAAFVPLGSDAEPAGVLALGYPDQRAFDDAEQEFVLALAAQCGLALERARRAEQSQWERIAAVVAQDRLAFLTEASGILAAALDPETMLEQVGRLAIPRVADLCAILLVDEQQQALRPRVVSARDDHTLTLLRQQLDRGQQPLGGPSVLAAVVRTGRTKLLGSLSDDLLLSNGDEEQRAAVEGLGITSSIIAPLRGRARIHGVLVLAGQREDLPYTEMDLTLAETLGRRIGVALEKVPRARPADPRAEFA